MAAAANQRILHTLPYRSIRTDCSAPGISMTEGPDFPGGRMQIEFYYNDPALAMLALAVGAFASFKAFCCLSRSVINLCDSTPKRSA